MRNTIVMLLGLVLCFTFTPLVAEENFDPMTLVIDPNVDAQVIRLDKNGLYVITWSVPADKVDVFGRTQPDAIDRDNVLASVKGAEGVVLADLDPTKRYYFELFFTGGIRDGETVSVAERFLPLERAENFRDIGGYRTADGRSVKWGLIYRTDKLSLLTDADLDYLADLQLKMVVDFRGQDEIDSEPDRLPSSVIKAINPQISGTENAQELYGALLTGDVEATDAAMAQLYQILVDNYAVQYGTWLNELADPNQLPAAHHCTAGKDRAGIATALLLSVLGVPEETVVADYTLSNYAFDSLLAESLADPQFIAMDVPITTLSIILAADPVWMEKTLAYIKDTYGSVENYLKTQGGVTDATLTALRANLLQ
ncbi:MAG: tyrosine-protein phosphatase [Phycisphaerales bacterium]